jgi:hypothetical protein
MRQPAASFSHFSVFLPMLYLQTSQIRAGTRIYDYDTPLRQLKSEISRLLIFPAYADALIKGTSKNSEFKACEELKAEFTCRK